MSSILFKNVGILATRGNGFEFIENGYLGVEGDRIDYIGKEEPKKKYYELRECKGNKNIGCVHEYDTAYFE